MLQIEDADGNALDALLVRSWIEERWYSKSGRNSWDQIWALDVIIDDGDGGSIGWNAYWTSLQVNLLGDDLLETSLREGLTQAAVWSDYFLANGSADPDCPNDRSDEKPERWENESAE